MRNNLQRAKHTHTHTDCAVFNKSLCHINHYRRCLAVRRSRCNEKKNVFFFFISVCLLHLFISAGECVFIIGIIIIAHIIYAYEC